MVLDGVRRLRLLSLDGGGIRGLSTIMILKDIMRGLNRGRAPDTLLRPYQVFDLIGGTSTGGILAVMLGRLRMSVEECEAAYLTMSERIFNPRRGAVNIVGRARDLWKVEGRFDSDELNASIWEILDEQGASREELLQDSYGPCKVFVCAVLTSNTSACVLRSYPNDFSAELLYDSCTIWEACRATSAATSFFDPITIGPYGQKFADGAIKYNNPIQLVYREAETLWPGRARDATLISLGTGSAPSPALEGNIVQIVQALKEIVVQSESAANDFFSDHGQMADNEQLYRFNVYHGLGEIGLEEYKETRRIADATHAYLTNGETRQRWRRCVQRLAEDEKSGNSLAVSANMSLPIRPYERKASPLRPHLPNSPLSDAPNSSSADISESGLPRANVRPSLSDSALLSSAVNKLNANKVPPEHVHDLNSRLIHAVEMVDIEEVRKALMSGANVNSEQNRALTLAATIGENDIVSLLLQNGGQINMSDNCGQTPLFNAVVNENYSTAKLLIGSGAYVDAINQEKCTPLHMACIKGNQQLVKVLLESGADATLRNFVYSENGHLKRRTALHEAAKNNQPGVIDILLDAGTDIEILDNDGYSPLLTACAGGLHEVVATLLDRGANIEVCSGTYRNTPLMMASYSGDEKTVEMLIARGLKVDVTTTKDAWNELHIACYFGHEQVVELLVNSGANLEAKTSETVELHQSGTRPYYAWRNSTPLHLAAWSEKQEASGKIIGFLLSRGANPNSKNERRLTPLQNAKIRKNKAAIEILEKQPKQSILRRIFD